MALSDRTANTYSVRHTSSIMGKIDEGRQFLGIANRFYDSFSEEVNNLIDKEVSNDLFKKVMDKVNPYPNNPTEENSDEEVKRHAREVKNHEYIKETVNSNFEHEAKNGFGYTGWTLLNAWNSYELWEKKRRGVNSNKILLQKQANELVSRNSVITDKVKEVILNG